MAISAIRNITKRHTYFMLASCQNGKKVFIPQLLQQPFHVQKLFMSTTEANQTIINPQTQQQNEEEKQNDKSEKHEQETMVHKEKIEKMPFQAETKQLLDIVTHSLYTDKEIFMRELISNASDALEKARYLNNTGGMVDPETPLEVRITTDAEKGTVTIRDTGIGMTREELVSLLGTIAKSGSKAFVEKMKSAGKEEASNVIGQFGVGFYSAFMVADKVDVYARSADPSKDQQGHFWSSEGTGEFELAPADGVERGLKLVLHLKESQKQFADSTTLRSIVTKYSNYVAYPITVNDERINNIGAIWLKQPSEVTEEQYQEFYKFKTQLYDKPVYRIHYHTDTPLSIRALLYFPSFHTEKMGMARMDPGVDLYSRKVLIKAKDKDILPSWLRFVRGIVDSEDMPLNVSRENMQDSALTRNIANVLTSRILTFLIRESSKDSEKYIQWYSEFASFLKEGACMSPQFKQQICKLLRFETSLEDRQISFDEYISRMPPTQKGIYFLNASTREQALASPYYESCKARNLEVLFLYKPVDEFVMRNIEEYNNRKLISIDSTEMEAEFEASKTEKEKAQDEASQDTANELIAYFHSVLGNRLESVKAASRPLTSPAIIVDAESSALRGMMKYVDQSLISREMMKLKLEINPRHPVNLGLLKLRDSNPEFAKTVAEQIFDNACLAGDVMENPRLMVKRLNKIMEQTLQQMTGNVKLDVADASLGSDSNSSSTVSETDAIPDAEVVSSSSERSESFKSGELPWEKRQSSKASDSNIVI